MGLFQGKDEGVNEQLKRISDQLGFLEKKIDSLIEQRSGGGGGSFRRPGGFGGGRPNRGGQHRPGGFGGNRDGNREGGMGGNRDPRDHYRSRGQSNRPRGFGGGQRPHRPNNGNFAPNSAPSQPQAQE